MLFGPRSYTADVRNAEQFLSPRHGPVIYVPEQNLVAEHVPVIGVQWYCRDPGILHCGAGIDASRHGVADQRGPLLLQKADQALLLFDQEGGSVSQKRSVRVYTSSARTTARTIQMATTAPRTTINSGSPK